MSACLSVGIGADGQYLAPEKLSPPYQCCDTLPTIEGLSSGLVDSEPGSPGW